MSLSTRYYAQNALRNYLWLCFTLVATSALGAEGAGPLASLEKGLRPAEPRGSALPKVNETTEYYEIAGSQVDDLRSQICEKGCRWPDGKTYDSVTNWHVKWDYDREEGPQACSVRDFRVTVDILYRYPKWIMPNDPPRELVEKWERYLRRLTNHEEGHRDRAVEAAADLMRTVEGLPGSPTCKDLDRVIRSVSRKRMELLSEQQKKYDGDTCHGATQGAML